MYNPYTQYNKENFENKINKPKKNRANRVNKIRKLLVVLIIFAVVVGSVYGLVKDSIDTLTKKLNEYVGILSAPYELSDIITDPINDTSDLQSFINKAINSEFDVLNSDSTGLNHEKFQMNEIVITLGSDMSLTSSEYGAFLNNLLEVSDTNINYFKIMQLKFFTTTTGESESVKVNSVVRLNLKSILAEMKVSIKSMPEYVYLTTESDLLQLQDTGNYKVANTTYLFNNLNETNNTEIGELLNNIIIKNSYVNFVNISNNYIIEMLNVVKNSTGVSLVFESGNINFIK